MGEEKDLFVVLEVIYFFFEVIQAQIEQGKK